MRKKVLSLFLVLCMVLTMLPTAIFAEGDTVISGIEIPVTGGIPVITISETEQYTGTVTWTPNDSTFLGSKVYTATITLTPKAGYTLTGVPANFFTVAGAMAINEANSGVITAVFPETSPAPISIGAISGIESPVTGGTPVSSISDTSEYTGTVTWSPNDSTFLGSKVYTATITVTPKAGYTLTGVPANFFTVAGATATNAANSGVIKAIFPETDEAPTVTSITAANGTYPQGSNISITVTFSSPITVTGTPYLELETGTTDRTASYASGSGTNKLTFNYTVQAGDTAADLDYKAIDSLKLNGGTIKDINNNDAILSLPVPGAANSLGANQNILIDTEAPSAITISAQNTIPAGGSVTLTAVGGPLSTDSWTNILFRIRENTGQGENWITGITTVDLTITPAGDGVTATLNNGSDSVATIAMDFVILASNVVDLVGNVAAGNITIDSAGISETERLQKTFDEVVDGGSIQLWDNITLDANVTILSGDNRSFTLDLNGKTLNGGNKIAIMHEGSGTLTIKDTAGNGGIASNSSLRTIQKRDGQLKVENTLLENTSSAGAVISAYDSEVSISNSEVKSSYRGINLSGTSNVFISNTNVESKKEAIYYFSGGTGNISITGGTIENTDTSAYAIDNQGLGKISIPGGSSVIKSNYRAMNKAPDLSGNTNVIITGSKTNKEGTDAVDIVKDAIDTDAKVQTYKYLKFEQGPPNAPHIYSPPSITNDNTPTISGTADPGNTVTITSSPGGELGTTTADASGKWSITSKELADGIYTITATAANGAGTTSSYAPVFTRVDTIRPTANILIGKIELSSGETATVTIAFSESVTGFNNSDLTVPNGSLSAVSTVDSKTFTATFTAGDVNAAENRITLDLMKVTDSAENTGSGTVSSPNYSIVKPATVPDAPTNVTAVAGDGQAAISFTPPASNGGALITGYTVTANPGGANTTTGSGSTIAVVTGLTNGTSYTFTVRASNSIGTSVASVASNSVTPAATQTITFDQPASQNFGTTPTLIATSTSGLPVFFTSNTPEICTITSNGKLTFLSAGTAIITASQVGNAAYLPAVEVTRTFTVMAVKPGVPTNVTAVAGDGQATISFTHPAFNGGAAITSYTLISSPDGKTATGNGSPITVTGLANGTSYTFTVTATNSAGTSAASAASNSVTPSAPATTYTITLNANGGNTLTPSTLTTDGNGKLSSLPVPTRSGNYSFRGWFTASSGGTAVTTSTVFSEDTTIYAQWNYSGGSGGSGGSGDSGGSSPAPLAPETTPVTGQIIDSKTGAVVQGITAQTRTSADGTAVVQVKAQEAIIFKQPNGTQSSLSDISKLGFTPQTNKDAKITTTANGTIEMSNLASNTQSKFAIQLDLGSNRKITIGSMEVKVGNNGNVTSVTSTLIDPYGTIIDAATGQVITDAHVTLYYADTERNKQNGNTANTHVDLPILDDFKPNNNKNPQNSDKVGFYAFMVYPNADYYLVATKEGYETYRSMTISVEEEIVKWDFKMTKPLTGVKRLSGDNRVDTALAIAKASYTTKLQNVILTTANNYPDALAGSVLAYKLNAPILLMDTSESEQKKVIDYLKANLNPTGTVTILGGTGAVGLDVESKIKAAGFTKVTRISGKDRSETALKIVEQIKVPTGRPIILVHEESYADALSISSSAAAGETPILLVGKDKISDAVRQKIAEINPIKVYIVGGEGVLSSQISAQVASITGLSPNKIIRLGGADRYATSLAVAQYFNLPGQSISFATGKNFPDALAGGVFSANYNAPIVLVDEALSTDTLSYLKTRIMVGGALLGGEGVLSKKIEQELSPLIRK
ncbi:MAG: cell wall-binding repeat-containing protein [Desulfitobacterium sp.]